MLLVPAASQGVFRPYCTPSCVSQPFVRLAGAPQLFGNDRPEREAVVSSIGLPPPALPCCGCSLLLPGVA